MPINKCILLSAALSVFPIICGFSQDYSVSSIPDSLKENAHYVIRDYTKEFELLSVNSGVERIKKVITILDKNGESDAYLAISYDKNSTVSITQILLFDATGKKIRKVKQSEIEDYPAYSVSLYSDDRIKLFKPGYAEYPYTVEYDYEVKSTNLISYGLWSPVEDYNTSAVHCQLTFICPTSIKPNKKEINISGKTTEINGNKTIAIWTLSNFKAIEEEPFDISISERLPSVYLMPTELVYDNYKGSACNWKEYGKWAYDLYDGRDVLSDAEKLKISSLLNNITDTILQMKLLFKYMQENTRYVGIQLGIGGFQPFDAKTVFETGYGDCKALSNYMHSLLKFIGIKSYPALVSSGKYIEPILNDFPNFSQFDHVILCIPQISDTIWLECTNQKIPFGFLGDFTDDRDVLLITENGGKFAHTKKYEADENLRSCKSHFSIDSTGTAKCTIETMLQGLQYNNISKLLNSNYDEQKKWLYGNSTLPSLQISNFTITEIKNSLPLAIVNESSISRNFCSFSGKYMLLPLNQSNVQKPVQKMLKTRYSDMLINRSFTDYDTLIYEIPKNYKFESLPQGKTINSNFGYYSCFISVNGNEITYVRRFQIKQGRYKPSEYKDFFEFILSVSKADNIKIMLTKKT
jgi:hypothetical protein